MKFKRIGKWFVFAGLLLVVAALCITLYNLGEQARAFKSSADVLGKLDELKAEEPSDTNSELPPYLKNPNMEMPKVEIDGNQYIGIVSVPSLKLRLPVIDDWSYQALQIAPCRFKGSAYRNDMIIMAHNYAGHFGMLSNVRIGDEVYFEDIDGNVFSYEVLEVEAVSGDSFEDMVAGDWDLTLFTCTLSGRSRVTVRCEQVKSN